MRRTLSRIRMARVLLIAVLPWLLAPPNSSGQQTFWRQDVPLGDWFIAGNWTAGVPTSTHDAIFGRAMANGALVTTPGAQANNVFVGVVVTGMNGGSKGSLTVAAPGGGGTPGTLTIGNR